MKFVSCFFKTEPVPAGHIRAINCQLHRVRRIPLRDDFLDESILEIACPLRSHGFFLQRTSERDGETKIHQQWLRGIDAVKGLYAGPDFFGLRRKKDAVGYGFTPNRIERWALQSMPRQNYHGCQHENRNRTRDLMSQTFHNIPSK